MKRKMDRNRKIEIMGIVNVTDNSYIESSRCLGPDGGPDVAAAIKRIGALLDEGAGIIDIGACSTGPGTAPVSGETEWKRLEPVLKAAAREFPDARISVDTFRAEVVRRVFDAIGPFMVNDISAGEADAEMLPTVGELGLEYVAMHMRGNPVTMQGLTDYGPARSGMSPVTAAVAEYFGAFEAEAEKYGIHDWILDPGFGFAKTVEQNWQLMAEMDKVRRPGHRTLVGVSRKSMIYKKFKISTAEALPQTQVLHLAALERGADILRVHDAAEAVRTVEAYRALGF